MTRKPLSEPWTSYVAPLVALGVAGAGAAAVLAPNFFAPALAATGGVMLGSHVALERRYAKNKKTEEAFKVGKIFTVLYEQNKGLVGPDQLSYHAEITIDKANNFLAALAQQQGGQILQNGASVVYSFPHTQNMVDLLTNRAAQWADQQTDEILRENSQLKQTVIALQSMIRMHNQIPKAPDEPQTIEPPTRSLKKDKNPDNPWGNLL